MIRSTYSPGLVILSYLVAVLASHVTLSLAQRLRPMDRGTHRPLYWPWIVGGAFSMGTGIWSMHFIGMLAFHLPIQVAYDLPLTATSWAIAVLVSGFALNRFHLNDTTVSGIGVPGVFIGFGISAMHYTGMAAMRLFPGIDYDPLLFAASVFIAIGASVAALWIAFSLSRGRGSKRWHRIAAASVMGAAIVGMHYTGMAAAHFAPNAVCISSGPRLDADWLAITIATFTFLILGSTLLLSVIDAQLQSTIARSAEALRVANEELEQRVADRTSELQSANGALQRAYEDLRQTQQTVMQQERLRALGQMASGIAHDVNNALTPAALYLQSLLDRDRSLGSEARNYLVITLRAIEDVANTIARMREFYRPREPQLILLPVDLNEVLQHVIDLTRASWNDMPQERGILIRVQNDFTAQLPLILGAENEIRDALTNLVLNAVDAMPDGGTLTLRSKWLGPTSTPGATATRVSVEVCDTGVGMSEAVRNRCLEPFFTTKGERGTGLGLAMVYGMTQRHGAELEIESEPGAGTQMRLIFPVAATTPSTARAMDVQQRLGRLHILIVDDDPLILQSLQDALERDGHLTSVAHGGQAAIDRFRVAQQCDIPFDLVITDLGMPHIDGRAVATAVKSLAPALPVVLLTGWGYRLEAEADVPQHVDCVLSKPPKLHELRAVLANLAGRTSLAAAREA
jgi:NO-binding membrane sensor protein with MHYT domain/nitrogen-specific signal transduction histidine kinase/ActR/RegA family two-component response regulator